MKKNKHLVIGAGEVGRSLFNVLKPHYNIFLRDKNDDLSEKFDVIHICYPYNENFIKISKSYVKI